MNSFHWLRAFLILLVTCAVVVVLSSPAIAAGCGKHGMDGKHQMPSFAELDANGDEAVSKEEFHAFRAKRMAARAEAGGKMKNAASAPAFEDLDLDANAVLSAEEFAKHQAECPCAAKAKHD
jgi:hypothetical protein